MHPRPNEHDIQVCCSQPQPATNKETVAPIYSKLLCAIHHNTWAPTSTISFLIDEFVRETHPTIAIPRQTVNNWKMKIDKEALTQGNKDDSLNTLAAAVRGRPADTVVFFS
jgi:hypothetical protein